MSYTTRMEKAPPCPECGTALDASSHMTEDVKPTPGDLTICLRCSAILVFTPLLSLRSIDETELAALPEDLLQEMLDLLQAIRHVQKQRA